MCVCIYMCCSYRIKMVCRSSLAISRMSASGVRKYKECIVLPCHTELSDGAAGDCRIARHALPTISTSLTCKPHRESIIV